VNAKQDRRFSEQADRVGLALWPGEVLIAGVPYKCSLVKTHVEISADDTPAGVRYVEGIRVEISKCLLRVAPAFDTIVRDRADGGLYKVKIVDGAMDNDSSWFLTCAKKE
jgi:hypothetical protein